MLKPRVSGVGLYRRLMNYAAMSLAAFSAVVVLAPLFAILVYLVIRGAGAINWAFLTQIPKPWAKSEVVWPMPFWDLLRYSRWQV
jgi:ABC-type phosphate transport system permease subunit